VLLVNLTYDKRFDPLMSLWIYHSLQRSPKPDFAHCRVKTRTRSECINATLDPNSESAFIIFSLKAVTLSKSREKHLSVIHGTSSSDIFSYSEFQTTNCSTCPSSLFQEVLFVVLFVPLIRLGSYVLMIKIRVVIPRKASDCRKH
jgi:hypothetical protein